MTDQKQLLQHVLSVTDTLLKETEDLEHLDMLRGAQAVLHELLVRTERRLYLDSYTRGCELLSTCVAELGGQLEEPPEVLNDQGDPDELGRHIKDLQARLSSLIRPLVDLTSALSDKLLKDIVAWQEELNMRHLASAGKLAQTEGAGMSPEGFTREAVRDYLRKRFPECASLELARFTLLSGGFSKTTILLETSEEVSGHQSLVIRAEQDHNLLFYGGADVRREYPMIKLMHQAGVPVAEPLWLESDPGHLGNRFIVSRRVEGHNPGGNLGSEEPISDALVHDFFRVMARINLAEVDASDPLVKDSHLFEWLSFNTLTDCLHFYVTDFMRGLYQKAAIDPMPEIERAMVWLADNVPKCDEKPSIIHMDFNWNNLLVKNDRIQALLDWESSHPGDPAEELISSLPSMSGIMTLDEMAAAYREHTGKEISKFRLCYAQMTKFVANAITIFRAEKLLSLSPAAPIRLAMLAFPYRGHFVTGLNELIERAESVR